MQLDDLGNVLWLREQRFESPTATTPPVRIETFGYDRLNRLTYSLVTGQPLQSFTFTSNGNIASKSGIGSYTYRQRNHGPHAVTSVSQGTQVQRSYTYDPKGRMTHEYNGDSVSGLALREIAYTSFDQPRFIQHWGAAALSSDQGQLDDGTTAWDQICTINFYFGPGLQRLIQKKVKGKLATTTLSLGGYEIREVTGHTGTVIEREERSSFGNGVRIMRYLGPKETTSAQTSYEFAAKDHLGSDTATFDGAGQFRQQRGHLKPGEQQKTERQSYDAWGARRDGDTWAPAEGQVGLTVPSQPSGGSANPPSGGTASPPERIGSNLPRGYTGHEMLDDVGLVHMNGRLYDSALGRMCAADRDVQAPDMIQNYNRYSYVLNNPMNATDPSGHNWFKKILMIIVAVIIAVILIMLVTAAIGALANAAGGILGSVGTATTAGTGLAGVIAGTTATAASAMGSFLGLNVGIWLGATVGAAWSAINTTIAGGTFAQVLKAAVIGAANGAVNAIIGGYMHGLGVAQQSMLAGGTSISGTAIHLAAHGVAGGAMSAANGGSFRDGFIGGIAGAGISGVSAKIPGLSGFYNEANVAYRSVGFIAARTTIAAVGGGIGSVALGGKFADGAYSAAFFHLFNSEASILATDRNGNINKKALQTDGADIYVFRESREASTSVLVYEDGQYVGGYRGNVNPDGTGATDYATGKRGPPDGDYSIMPKTAAQDEGLNSEYVAGTPSITGKGRAVGSPAPGYNNTVRMHPYGGSTACQTATFEWADRIWDITARNPLGSVRMHIRTQSIPAGIPVGSRLSKPSAHPWPPFTGHRNPYQPY
jgi:RHS repeat-associated protein